MSTTFHDVIEHNDLTKKGTEIDLTQLGVEEIPDAWRAARRRLLVTGAGSEPGSPLSVSVMGRERYRRAVTGEVALYIEVSDNPRGTAGVWVDIEIAMDGKWHRMTGVDDRGATVWVEEIRSMVRLATGLADRLRQAEACVATHTPVIARR